LNFPTKIDKLHTPLTIHFGRRRRRTKIESWWFCFMVLSYRRWM